MTFPLYIQLSAVLGMSVRDIGVVLCREATAPKPNTVMEERCMSGCWVGLTSNYSIVDANSSAVVGPQVIVQGSCGCSGLGADAAITTTPGRAHSCSPDTCLNGGRCLSTPAGTR